MKLFATMCNQPQRLAEALAPARAALLAPPPIARWGLGYVQSGEVLLARTPRPSTTPVDLFAALEGVKSDCVLGHAVAAASRDGDFGGTAETPPYRYRRWMFVEEAPAVPAAVTELLIGTLPDFLRRSMKGKGLAEVTFHALLALLHDASALDDPNLAMPALRKAIAGATARVAAELETAGVAARPGNLAVSNSRQLAVARLAGPVYLRRLHVAGERGGRDETFRGVLLVSGGTVDGEGFEEIPAGNVVTVSRDLRVEIHPL